MGEQGVSRTGSRRPSVRNELLRLSNETATQASPPGLALMSLNMRKF